MPCNIEDIPIIDAVIISHNHYDHLSHPTILKIKAKHPQAHFFAPLGNKKWFTDSGVEKATELDWWQSKNIRLSEKAGDEKGTVSHVVTDDGHSSSTSESSGGISAIIGCRPCQHASARSGWDRNQTLWSSWSVESGGKKVWFGGYGLPCYTIHGQE